MGNGVYKFHAGGFKLDSNDNVKVLFCLLKEHIAIIRTSSKTNCFNLSKLDY